MKTKIHQEFFPSYFDKLTETLEDIIEGRVASQGQPVGRRRESARELAEKLTTNKDVVFNVKN